MQNLMDNNVYLDTVWIYRWIWRWDFKNENNSIIKRIRSWFIYIQYFTGL